MLFNLRTAATMAFGVFAISPSFASVTPTEAVANIQALTTKSQALQEPANSITIVNGLLLATGQGPLRQIITGFVDIVSTATGAITQMQGSAPVTAGPSAAAIANAFREFVRVHQVLLNILIGKAGLFSTVPFIGQPMSAVLRQVEGVVDTIAYGLIDMVQSEASSLTSEHASLSASLELSIKSFSGIQTSRVRRGSYKA